MKRRFYSFLLSLSCSALLMACGKTPVVTNSGNAADEASAVPATEESSETEAVTESAEEIAEEATGAPTEQAKPVIEHPTVAPEYLEASAKGIKISIANICGTDIDNMQITLDKGGITDVEILGDEKLPDGRQFDYSGKMFDSVADEDEVTLTVTAQDMKGYTIEFEKVNIYDIKNAVIVLDKENKNYKVYIK